MAITVKQVTDILEDWAPRSLQESYDNSGLQIGTNQSEVTGILFALDATEAVLHEALALKCNLIVVHHPLIFSGLKSISGKTAIERMAIYAIKNDISIYAIHTNLDNIATGVNKKIADKLGLIDTRILQPMKNQLLKLSTYVPEKNCTEVLQALWAAGAGNIGNYSECSFAHTGEGTFKPGETTNPTIGASGGQRELVVEKKIELLIENIHASKILHALKAAHPYEEVAYELVPIQNLHQDLGAGMIGEFERDMLWDDFLPYLKNSLNVSVIRYTEPTKTSIKKVALCGGSGSFLLANAIAAGADVFITGDFKYHQFFDAEGKIVIADIGHYESEQFTPELIKDFLSIKIPNIALHLTKTLTNPVKYYHL